MAYLERIYLSLLFVTPFLLIPEIVFWLLLMMTIWGVYLVSVVGRWAIWPAVGFAGLETILIGLGVDVTIILLASHTILVVISAILVGLLPIPRWTSPSGSYRVGYRELDVPMDAGKGKIHVWYPTDNDSSSVRKLQTREEAMGLREVQLYLGNNPTVQSHMKLGETNSVCDAAISLGRFPLVVFNHGGGLWPNQNYSLLESIASEGYVVISVGHYLESAGLIYADGSAQGLDAEMLADLRGSADSAINFADYLLSETAMDQEARFENLRKTPNGTQCATERWARQTLSVIDWLQSRGPEEFIDAIDFETVVYMGMSLGGSVAYRCCQLDDRSRAGINFDGMIWDFEHQTQPLQTHFLMCYSDLGMLGSDVSHHLGRTCSSYAALPFNDVYFKSHSENSRILCLEYPDSKHLNYTDFGLAARSIAKSWIGLGPTQPQIMLNNLRALVIAFLSDSLDRSQDAVDSEIDQHAHWRVAGRD